MVGGLPAGKPPLSLHAGPHLKKGPNSRNIRLLDRGTTIVHRLPKPPIPPTRRVRPADHGTAEKYFRVAMALMGFDKRNQKYPW
jgi:hypothetical protein